MEHAQYRTVCAGCRMELLSFRISASIKQMHGAARRKGVAQTSRYKRHPLADMYMPPGVNRAMEIARNNMVYCNSDKVCLKGQAALNLENTVAVLTWKLAEKTCDR